MRSLVGVATALLLSAPSPRVSLHVSPLVSAAPSLIRLRVTVEPADDQRIVRVEAASENHQRATEIQLDGIAGPRTSFIDWRDMPSGEYDVLASVGTTTRVVATARAHFIVTGSE